MAARQQPKGTGLGIQYEDLVPKSEFKDLPEATLLTIDLPDFEKEQIKVTYVHTSKMIRVTGERQVGDRSWSRFNKVFTVPHNCLVDKINGSFKNNVLTITMPKETITKTSNLPEASKTVEKLEEKKFLEELEQKKKQLLEKRDGLSRKLEEEAKATEKAEMTKKLQEEVKAKEKPEEKKLVEEDTVEKIQERKHVDESGEKEKIIKPEERKLPEVVYTKSGSGSGSGSKPGSGGVSEVVKSVEEKIGYVVEKEKKMGKGIMEKIRGKKEITSEEKKLMVNVGVAAFVIFALGAYVSYSFCSSSSSSPSPSPSSSSSSTKRE